MRSPSVLPDLARNTIISLPQALIASRFSKSGRTNVEGEGY